VIGVCDEAGAACIVAASNEGGSCDDGVPCTTGDTCSSGACEAGSPVLCPDSGNPCIALACDPGGADGNCDVEQAANDGATCDDGAFCTVDDACLGGACSGASRDCSELDGVCIVGTCSEKRDNCVAVVAEDGTPCADLNACTVDESCSAGECVSALQAECPDGGVVWVDPPDGVVDAGQPHAVTSVDPPQGIDRVIVEAPGGAPASCWCLCESDQTVAGPNDILGVTEGPAGTYEIELVRPITAGAATSLTYGNSATAYFIAHPANVNADDFSGPLDILAMIDILNGVFEPPYGDYSADVDRTNVVAPLDILRVIDLLNGGDAFDPWIGTQRPASTCP
jgi:hypothetical protein